jgi:shikimate dehydrogenase
VTLRVALLGKPLRRRHSVVMHNAAFAAAGIDGRYELMEIDESDVPAAVAAARASDEWLGLGVTAPYKQLVASLVDDVEDDAREIGAVNNVVRSPDGRLIGFNTDAPGFRVGAEQAMAFPLTGARVVVAGAGGVARAIVHACRTAGVESLTVGNRTPRQIDGVEVVPLDSNQFVRALQEADLVVNATTVGMMQPGVTIDVEQLAPTATVFDCVYVPAETPLLAAARGRGLIAANGSEMLIAQAAIAFERWTGVSGMADVMREAVTPLLADPAAQA